MEENEKEYEYGNINNNQHNNYKVEISLLSIKSGYEDSKIINSIKNDKSIHLDKKSFNKLNNIISEIHKNDNNNIINDKNSIFDYAAANKLQLRTRRSTYIQNKGYQDYYDYSDLNDFKRKIYTELFGAPKGPIYQTDAEKIQAHGFDNKISFRKRKED
jgi:hypothetical protein